MLKEIRTHPPKKKYIFFLGRLFADRLQDRFYLNDLNLNLLHSKKSLINNYNNQKAFEIELAEIKRYYHINSIISNHIIGRKF